MIRLSQNINPEQLDIDEWVVLAETNEQGNHYLVHRYSILTTSYVCYAVYEPSALMGNHSTITTREETRPDGSIYVTWLGDVTTRRLPDALEAMTPGSQERIKAVDAYLDGWKAFAESLIRSAFPQDFEEAIAA